MSTNIIGIFSIVALVCFIALVTMQVLELLHFSATPSVWPM